MKALFFPGCLIPIKYPQMELALRRTLPALGIEIADHAGFSCCPDPIYFQSSDRFAWLTLAARNLALIEATGLEAFTVCSGCTGTLREANHLLQEDGALRERVNQRLARIGLHYQGTARVRHIVTLIRDELGIARIAASVTRPLRGARVALHYGCHLLKPSPIMQVDDPDDPQILHALVSALGAEPVAHDERFLCCGKACIDDELPLDMTATVLRSVKATGADCMGMICPTCFSSFDTGQLMIERQRKEKLGVPPVYYFQLLGLAQGLSPQEVGLTRHKIKPVALLAKLDVPTATP